MPGRRTPFVNSVFAFVLDGRIRITVYNNCPGAWHDNAIAEHGVYQRIVKVHKECNDAKVGWIQRLL